MALLNEQMALLEALQRGRRARRRRSTIRCALTTARTSLQRGRRARRRRSESSRSSASPKFSLQRGRRARRRRSRKRAPSVDVAGTLQRGRRARRRRSVHHETSKRVRRCASTRPACETPEIRDPPRGWLAGEVASTRPACETPEIFPPWEQVVPKTDALQRGRRARRRRSLESLV